MRFQKMKLEDITPAEYNPRLDLQPGDPEYEKIKRSILEFDLVAPLIYNERTQRLVGGHQRLKVIRELGYKEVDVSVVNLDEQKEKALNIALNKIQGDWDQLKLAELLKGLELEEYDLELTGFDTDEIEELLAELSPTETEQKKEAIKTLAERFIVPPFSILDTRQGYWQDRRQEWLAIGLRGEVGRSDKLLYSESSQPPQLYEKKNDYEAKIGRKVSWDEFYKANPDVTGRQIQTSIFDPVLCEILYNWFCPAGGKILDPFAGGSTRGITAALTGFEYIGVELRPEQVASNEEQWAELVPLLPEGIKKPLWIIGDSTKLDELLEAADFDMIFTCPPYYDLEVYSDDAADLSTFETYEQFMATYKDIFQKAVNKLQNNRFLAIVITEIRDKKTGIYRNFVGDNTQLFTDLGLSYYNDAILINQISSLAIRAQRIFRKRKLGRTHQNVLMFVKGDAKEVRTGFQEMSKDLKISRKGENILVFYKGNVEEINDVFPAEAVDVSKAELEGMISSDWYDPGPEPSKEQTRAKKKELTSYSKQLGPEVIAKITELTPVEKKGDYYLKRDDLFNVAGIQGGKVRTCYYLAQGAPGLVTAGSRSSPQVNIVAQIAKHLNIPCRVHIPWATTEDPEEIRAAKAAGAEVEQHRPGYNNVIIKRAADDAKENGWVNIPFGMECQEAVNGTANQTKNIPKDIKRIVVPVGSGMSLAGILHGLQDQGLKVPVLGVKVGADPEKRLETYAPTNWRQMVKLVKSKHPYDYRVTDNEFQGVPLDPIYEAKCIPYLRPGDLLWIVGHR